MAFIYIDGTNGNDTTGTGTRALPYKKISKGYTEADNGDTIYLMDSAFTEVTQGANWLMQLNRDNIDVTFDRDPLFAGTITLDVDVNNAVRVSNDGSEINIKNVTINDSAADKSIFVKLDNITANTTFTDCILTNAGSGAEDLAVIGNGTAAGDAKFVNCTITADNNVFELMGCGDFLVRGCTVTCGGSLVFENSGRAVNNVTMLYSTLTATGEADDFIFEGFETGITGTLLVQGNTINNSKKGIAARGIGYTSIKILDNIFPGVAGDGIPIRVGWEDGEGIGEWVGGENVAQGDVYEYIDVFYEAVQAENPSTIEPGTNPAFWTTDIMTNVEVKGNNVTENGADAHVLFVGYGVIGADISSNICAGGNFGIVCKGDYCKIYNNIVKSPNSFAQRAGSNNEYFNNTGYATGGDAALKFFQEDTLYPTNCTVKNNIFDGSGGADYAIQILDNTAAATHTVDNNCYKAGSSGVAILGAAPVVDTIGDIQAKWVTLGTTNDVDTIVADPLYVEDGVDFHLQSTSPCINAGANVGVSRDFDGNQRSASPDIGAFEFVEDGIRGRYDNLGESPFGRLNRR